jgi:hypothetical protein
VSRPTIYKTFMHKVTIYLTVILERKVHSTSMNKVRQPCTCLKQESKTIPSIRALGQKTSKSVFQTADSPFNFHATSCVPLVECSDNRVSFCVLYFPVVDSSQEVHLNTHVARICKQIFLYGIKAVICKVLPPVLMDVTVS